jgi:phosphatidylglycerophosphate synthase
MTRAEELGAKARDYWWTVLFVDPLALPMASFLGRKRWITADQMTWLSFFLGVPIGFAFATGERWGLVVGGLLWYLAFLTDCIDGKLARALGTSSPKGKILDEIADGGRRLSGSLGLAVYLWRVEDGATFFLAVAYGLLAFYFGQISGGTRPDPVTKTGSGWSEWLARKRLLPTPGAPDIAALVFLVGPVTGLVVPTLILGDAAFALGILAVMLRMAR